VTAAFSGKGIKDDWFAAFMMSSILLNPQLIIYSAALGATALTVRVVTCFFSGVIAGLFVRVFYARKGRSFFRFDSFREPPSTHDTDPNIALRLLKNIWRNIRATGLYFFFGIVLSALKYLFLLSLLKSWLKQPYTPFRSIISTAAHSIPRNRPILKARYSR
jgi:uncharacterized membrane protein YraQ (UPF0718 family)